jgi:DNA invertase Pin-like site-specific DNA recombinase
MKFVAYYRVSTQRQGRSGLGLEAQKAAVENYNGAVIAEYVEVESGRQHANRPELAKALAHCRSTRATLLIAKLDRLSRNVAFLAQLMESGAEIVCADMPDANRLTLHMMAAIAEHESRAISQRTKAAIAARTARGKRWDHSRPPAGTAATAAHARAERSKQTAARRVDLLPVIEEIQSAGGSTLREIANELNERGFVGGRGGKFYPATVRRLLNSN